MKTGIAVIGGGPGGYVAAIRAAQLGADVTLIESDKIGGTCLNWGCIPTKALYKNALMAKDIKDSNKLGFEINNVKIDFSEMIKRKDKIVDRLTDGVNYLLKQNGVDLVKGKAEIVSGNLLNISGKDQRKIEADNIIIATGSKPIIPPIPGINLPGVMTSKEFLDKKDLPEKLVVVGGGVIGIEFASIYSELGCEVTVLEQLESILPGFDEELSRELKNILINEKGIDIKLGAKVENIQEKNNKLQVNSEEDEVIADTVLIAIGRKPNSPPSKKVNIKKNNNGEIKVNKYLETNIKGIYAIGDVIGNYQLAHVASREGIVAVNNIISTPQKMEYKEVPSVVFSLPEVASVGMQEKEAKRRKEIKVGRFPYNASGKAMAMEEKLGFVKIIADEEWNEILGVHILGHNASTMIGEAGLGIKLEVTAEELGETIHAHPTMSEMLMEAAEDVDGLAIHI